MKQVSLNEALRFAFSTYCDHFVHFMKLVGLTLLTLIVGLIIFIIGFGLVFRAYPALAVQFHAGEAFQFSKLTHTLYIMMQHPLFLLGILLLALCIMLTLSLFVYHVVRAGLAVYENKPLPYKGFFAIDATAVSFLAARLWFIIKCLIGTLLFIAPGVYIFITNFFSGFSIADGTSTSVGQDKTYTRDLVRGSGTIVACFVVLYWLGTQTLRVLPLAIVIMPFLDLMAVHMYKQLERNR